MQQLLIEHPWMWSAARTPLSLRCHSRHCCRACPLGRRGPRWRGCSRMKGAGSRRPTLIGAPASERSRRRTAAAAEGSCTWLSGRTSRTAGPTSAGPLGTSWTATSSLSCCMSTTLVLARFDPHLFFLFNPMLAKRLLSGITVSAELCKVPASQLEEKKLKAYRTNEKEEMNTLLNQYLDFCRVSLKVQAETLVIEKNSPATGIIELIDQNHITKLVMGTSSISAYDQMQYFSFIKRFS